MTLLNEPARDIPIAGTTDVFIAGAGPAGVTAALAAARSGASVQLVDVNGCLGGVWTAGLLSWVVGADRKGGIIEEIAQRLDARGARAYRLPTGKNWAYDPEIMKSLLEELCVAEGITFQYHTRVVATRVSDGRITHAITESKSGRQAWAARVFIDCSGDGDLAQFAGCGYDLGRPDDGSVQPMSFPVIVTGLRFADIEEFVGGGVMEAKRRLGDLLRSLGCSPSYPNPLLARIHDDMFVFVGDHQFGVPADDAAAITRATVQARREATVLIEALKHHGGVWKNIRLVHSAAHIGVREGRRIHGRGEITREDLENGTIPDDSIAICSAPFDVHSTKPGKGVCEHGKYGLKPLQPYGLPLRSLISRDRDGLMMAGRCISGDFIAHSSYRVTGDASAMGQGAGICAALAATGGVLPQEVPFADVRERLDALNAAPVG